MGKLQSPEGVRQIQTAYGFKANKSLGQNFLTDDSVIEDIVNAVDPGPEDLVIEIGPGLGVLTRALAPRCGRLAAIEIDKELIPILKETLRDHPNVTVVNQDVLNVDMKQLIGEFSVLPSGQRIRSVKIAGNLPYYITTPIIMSLLEAELPIESITMMVQKEVADRLMSPPSKEGYGVLTLHAAYYSTIDYIRDVDRLCFRPVPKVQSSVLRLNIQKERAVQPKDPDLMFRLIKAGFGQRRKTLINALKGGGFDADGISAALQQAGIDGRRRAESLSLEEFAAIADHLCN